MITKFAQSSIFRSPNDHQSCGFMVTLLQISCVILELADLLFSDFPSLKGKPRCQHSTWTSQDLLFWQIGNRFLCPSYVSLQSLEIDLHKFKLAGSDSV